MKALWMKFSLADVVLNVDQFVDRASTAARTILERRRGRWYDKQIRFPDLMTLIGNALLEHRASGHQSHSRTRESGDSKPV